MSDEIEPDDDEIEASNAQVLVLHKRPAPLPAPPLPEPAPVTIEVPALDESPRSDDIDEIPDDDDPSTDLEPYADQWNAARARAVVLRDYPLPTLRQIRGSVKWWARTLAKLLPVFIVRAIPVTFYQVVPVCRAIWRLSQTWAIWRCKSDWLADLKEAEGNERAKQRERFERRKRARSFWSVVLGVAAIIGAFIAFAYWPGYVIAALVLAVAWLDWFGRRGIPNDDAPPIIPSSALREGAPLRMVVAQVLDVLTGRGHEPTVVNPAVGEYGLTMDLHTTTEVDEEDIAALERGLQTFVGAVTRIQSPDNAAMGQLRVMWTDPLAAMPDAPYRAPLSCSINTAGDFGYGMGALPLELTLLRTNILVVGGPGSGKSSCFWCIVDYLTACKDVVLDGIDLSGGPALEAWGDCLRYTATDPGQAKELLHEALTLADNRTRQIAGRARPQRGGPPAGSENWGTADGPAHVILVDELPLLAGHKELLGMYSEHQRVGRKAASTSLTATQDLSGDTLKATSLRKYPSTTILLACSREDVISALGGGKIKEGWCPHRFVPAEGDDANDAGKAMIHSGRHRVPNPWRFNRIDGIDGVHVRALERIEAGMPTLGDEDSFNVVDSIVIPEDLAIFHGAFTAAGWPEFMATEDILAACLAQRGNAPTAKRLSELAAARGFTTDPTRRRSNGSKNPRVGYLCDAVRAAIARLEEAGT